MFPITGLRPECSVAADGSLPLPSAEEVARIVGELRGYLPAATVAGRLGVDVAAVATLPGVVDRAGVLSVPRVVARLAEAFGFGRAARIVAAGLVWTTGGERPLPSAADLAQVAGVRGGEMKHREFARRLGVETSAITAQFERGGLPGARRVSPGVVMVPRRLLRVALTYGLPQVERMANAGML